MASSSRPFQSQTVSRLLAGYRQMAHGAERLLRQGKTALLWGVQVIAFPLYVAFQGMRSAARTLQATKPWQQVVSLITGEQPQPLVLTPDSPIRALLSLTQPLAVRQSGNLRPVDRHGELLRQSRAESVMVTGQWQMVPLQTPVCGVASDLATRHLVLVTTNNVMFNGLTDLQREQLQRAITLLMAEYAGWCRRQWHQRQRQSPGLPLPQAERNQWLPVRWLNQALAWMQVSPLAQVTNLFGESDHGSALAVNPYTSIPVPYGVVVPLGDGDHTPSPHPGAITVTGTSSVATQAQKTRAVVTYLTEDGTVVTADEAEATTLASATIGDGGDAHQGSAGRGRTMGGGATLKGLPGNDAIEAQVALVNYVDHPLVVLLRWLDALLHGAETWLQSLWQWLCSHL